MQDAPDANRASAPARKSRLRTLLSWGLPYVVAAVVLTALLMRYDATAILAEIRRGSALPLVPVAIVTYVLSLLLVASADSLVLRGLLAPAAAPSWWAVAKGKAASVVLHVVHYALGQGAYGTWIGRRTGIGVTRTGGLMLYIVAAELGSVCLYATIVILVGRPAVPAQFLWIVLGISLAIVLLIWFAGSLPSSRRALFECWARIGRKTGLAQIGVRCVQHAVSTTGTWVAAQLFGLDVPLFVMLSTMPIILVVGSLPVNVAGFGAVQGAWLLLSPWAPAERILAFSVVWQAVSALALIARGLPFLGTVSREVRTGKVAEGESSTAEAPRGAA